MPINPNVKKNLKGVDDEELKRLVLKKDYYIEGIFANDELASLARDLEKELNEYPSR